MREPVSISAVPTMVSDPPSSILRAAPKIWRGACIAVESSPPESVRPVPSPPVLYARARRVIESSSSTTSLPSITWLATTSIACSAVSMCSSTLMSLEAAITLAGVLRLKSVTSSGRSSTSRA